MSVRSSILRRILVDSFLKRNIDTNKQAILRLSNMSNQTKVSEEPRGLLSVLEKNTKRYQRIKFLAGLFKQAHFELRIAGGAVRDILDGKEPQDIDFATTARPEQTLELVKKHEDILRVIVTTAGQMHGTVAVKFKEADLDLKRARLDSDSSQDDRSKTVITNSTTKPEYDMESPFEITTLRCDNLTDGRHAVVEFVSDWKVDAERRDLTINAMFLTLDDGKLIDYFDGAGDLKNGIVRFVGNADTRVKEDFLRILRYFRFWSRYGKQNQPDEHTKMTIQENLKGLTKISGERLWQEVKKTFSHLPCYQVAELMLEMGVFGYLGLSDPQIKDLEMYQKDALKDLEKVEMNVQEYIKTYLNPKLKIDPNNSSLKKLKDLMPIIVLAPIVQTYNMCMEGYKRMKFSNVERDSLLFIIENKKTDLDVKELKYHIVMSPLSERPQTFQRTHALLIYRGEFDTLEELESWEIPTFPITGHIVAQEFKRQKLPSEKIKNVMDLLKKHWADTDYKATKEDLEQVLVDKITALKQCRSDQ